MAEFLIKIIDAEHPDPVIDATGCLKRDDIVQSYPDETCNEPPHENSNFYIVKVPEISFETAEKYMKAQIENEFTENETIIKARRYQLNIDSLPEGNNSQLITERETFLTEAEFNANLIDKAE